MSCLLDPNKVIDKAKFLKFSEGWIYNGDVKPVSLKKKIF